MPCAGRRLAGSRIAAAAVPLVLAGCAGAPAAKPAPVLTEEQQAALVRVEKLYRDEDRAFAAERDRLAADPATAYWLTRLFVFHLLHAHDQRRADDAAFLATVTAEEDPWVRAAEEQLRALGPAAVPALVEDLLRSPHSDRRHFGAGVLAKMGPPVLPGIEPLLRDPDWRTRRLVIEAAAPMDSTPEVIAVLLRGAEDESFAVRAASLEALLRHGEAPIARVRRALADDPDPYVRRMAAMALAEHPSPATAEALVAYYADCLQRADVRGAEAAAASLQKISGHRREGDLAFWRAWLATYSEKGQR